MVTDVNKIKPEIAAIVKRHDVKRAALFGSFARGDANENSDLDIVVELKGDKSLLDLVGLKLDIEDALGIPVDILTYNSLNPVIREKVLKEQLIIL